MPVWKSIGLARTDVELRRGRSEKDWCIIRCTPECGDGSHHRRLGFVAGVRVRPFQDRNRHFTVEVRILCAEMSVLWIISLPIKVVFDSQLNRLKPTPMAESNWELVTATGVSSH